MKIFTMTKTVALNLARGPATLMYPGKARPYPPLTRGGDRERHREMHLLRGLRQEMPDLRHRRGQGEEGVAD